MAKIDNVVPGLANGKDGELFQKVKSIRELADSFNKHSGAFMEEGRRSLLDISEAANKVTRKFDPQAVSGDNPPPPRKPVTRGGREGRRCLRRTRGSAPAEAVPMWTGRRRARPVPAGLNRVAIIRPGLDPRFFIPAD